MAKESRHAMEGETSVSITLFEPITHNQTGPDMLDDVIQPWLRNRHRAGYYRVEAYYVPGHLALDATREDFIFYFTNPDTAFEFKMRFG